LKIKKLKINIFYKNSYKILYQIKKLIFSVILIHTNFKMSIYDIFTLKYKEELKNIILEMLNSGKINGDKIYVSINQYHMKNQNYLEFNVIYQNFPNLMDKLLLQNTEIYGQVKIIIMV